MTKTLVVCSLVVFVELLLQSHVRDENGGRLLARGEHTVFVGGGQPGFAENAVSARVSFDATDGM